MTLYAKWTIKQYTVTYVTDMKDVKMPAAETADYGETVTFPTVPAVEGYTGEWQIDGKPAGTSIVVKDNVTVKAVYTIQQYTVTYVTDMKDVDMPEPATVDYGETVEFPTVPIVEGYTGEWQIDGNPAGTSIVVKGDVTVKAVYTKQQYTVTYVTEMMGVDMPSAQTVSYGETVTFPPVPTLEGYTGEWQIDGKPAGTSIVVKGDVTVTAVYTKQQDTGSSPPVSEGESNDPPTDPSDDSPAEPSTGPSAEPSGDPTADDTTVGSSTEPVLTPPPFVVTPAVWQTTVTCAASSETEGSEYPPEDMSSGAGVVEVTGKALDKLDSPFGIAMLIIAYGGAAAAVFIIRKRLRK